MRGTTAPSSSHDDPIPADVPDTDAHPPARATGSPDSLTESPVSPSSGSGSLSSGNDSPSSGNSRYTLRVGSSITDFAQASAAVDRAQMTVFELTAGIILGEAAADLDLPAPGDGEPYRFASLSESVSRATTGAGGEPEGADGVGGEAPALPDFLHFSLDTTFAAWVHDHVRSEHVAETSTILGTTTARSYRHFTQSMTLIFGLPRFTARALDGQFTHAQVVAVADLCQTVAFRHLPELDDHLATRRADITSDTLRASLRKKINLLQTPADRAEVAAERRRVSVETFSDGSACLMVNGPADEIHACFARVQAMARAIHAGQTNTFGLPSRIEIIDERDINALMCDILLRPQPKLRIRVRELDPVTGIESERSASMLDDTGEPLFSADERSISGLTDLLDPPAAPDRNTTADPTTTSDGPSVADPRTSGGDSPPADTYAPGDPRTSTSPDTSRESRDGTPVSCSPGSPGSAFFPGPQPHPVPREYFIDVSMPTGPHWIRNQAGLVVTLPLMSLLGDSNLPGVLPDGSPIPAETARRIAAGSPTLTRILTDPATGTPINAQAKTYAIPQQVRRTLISQWMMCTVPGCRKTAEKSEIDHVDPFNHDDPSHGGLTRFGNLHPLCKKDHALKTARRYSVRMGDRGSATPAVDYQFGHGLMTTVTAPDQPINAAQAIELYELLREKPLRRAVPDHEVPDESAIVEVMPTEAQVAEWEAERRRVADEAARQTAMKDAITRSGAARRRRRLWQALHWNEIDWNEIGHQKSLPPGSDLLTMKALPPGPTGRRPRRDEPDPEQLRAERRWRARSSTPCAYFDTKIAEAVAEHFPGNETFTDDGVIGPDEPLEYPQTFGGGSDERIWDHDPTCDPPPF
ncbi:HNH endonuclease signature motif containing protein [Brevibacterium casei]|uniref:HNH endonuclease n=1 Tax=Brevibacterium casei TaxID=33889 RepID=A0A7T4DIZ5_9MICO|nr:HNH endonuclease signature motif containing protein [Brevibacterium casei]QQB15082.1 HNH endonuclease [Brevibacterium casei]